MNRHELNYQIRYAIRLTERSARLYRRIQTLGIFLSILGGSATLLILARIFPEWISLLGGFVLAVSGCALIAIRPADKAAQNELDRRRYQDLAAKAIPMNDAELSVLIEEFRESDCPDVESLRKVAYNDVVIEYGRPDAAIPLTRLEHFIAAIA